MEFVHLFGEHGRWLGYRVDGHVYRAKNRSWAGWLPWEDGIVVDGAGEYLATIWETTWLVCSKVHPRRSAPLRPPPPISPIPSLATLPSLPPPHPDGCHLLSDL